MQCHLSSLNSSHSRCCVERYSSIIWFRLLMFCFVRFIQESDGKANENITNNFLGQLVFIMLLSYFSSLPPASLPGRLLCWLKLSLLVAAAAVAATVEDDEASKQQTFVVVGGFLLFLLVRSTWNGLVVCHHVRPNVCRRIPEHSWTISRPDQYWTLIRYWLRRSLRNETASTWIFW